MIDVASGWSERRIVLGRSFLVIRDAFRSILGRLPFRVLERSSFPFSKGEHCLRR
jgi:hypothetical protein